MWFCFLFVAHAETISQAFPPPAGAASAPKDAFGRWLAELPVRAPDVPVRTYDGRVVGHPARVVELPLVRGDLQQCADSAIRLRAEWQRSEGQSELSFHATSGDPIPWARFQAGERPHAEGNHIVWTGGHGPGSWDGWLRSVFMWAGTRSLEAYETTPVATPRPGDVLVKGGSPGHAVVLLDVAARDGRTYILIGEGFMPAQDFHVELGPVDGWWEWTDAGLALPHWPMPADALRRWTTSPG